MPCIDPYYLVSEFRPKAGSEPSVTPDGTVRQRMVSVTMKVDAKAEASIHI